MQVLIACLRVVEGKVLTQGRMEYRRILRNVGNLLFPAFVAKRRERISPV